MLKQAEHGIRHVKKGQKMFFFLLIYSNPLRGTSGHVLEVALLNSIEHGFGFLGIKIHSANRRFLESNNGARKSHADLGHISQPGNQVITQYQNETLDILLSMSRMDQSGSKSNPLMH